MFFLIAASIKFFLFSMDREGPPLPPCPSPSGVFWLSPRGGDGGTGRLALPSESCPVFPRLSPTTVEVGGGSARPLPDRASSMDAASGAARPSEGSAAYLLVASPPTRETDSGTGAGTGRTGSICSRISLARSSSRILFPDIFPLLNSGEGDARGEPSSSGSTGDSLPALPFRARTWTDTGRFAARSSVVASTCKSVQVQRAAAWMQTDASADSAKRACPDRSDPPGT